jgi:uncharacterized membrane protein
MKKAFLAFAACAVLTGTASAQARFVAVGEILGARCVTCHEWAASYKGIADPSRVVASFPEKSLLYQVISADRMPPSAVKLRAEDKALIKAWIAAGALPNESPPYPGASKEQSTPAPEPCPCGLE